MASSAGNDAAGHAILVSKLKMVGSCRGPDDEARLQQLQEYAEQLELGNSVEWYVNVPFSELKMLLGDAVGGLHTMMDEHFGISVVEYMAAGGGGEGRSTWGLRGILGSSLLSGR